MAELGVVASILGVAGAGIKLTVALYAFGSNVAGAKEQADEIADAVSIHCMTLKELAARLDGDEPVHSARGLQLAKDLQGQSERLFQKIASLLPPRDKTDKMTPLQRLRWNFRRVKVEWLLAQLNGLKLSLLVLLQVLYAGRVIKNARDAGDASVETQEQIDLQEAHLGALIVQRYQQTSCLAEVGMAAEKEEKSAIEASPNDPPEGFVPVDSNDLVLVRLDDSPLAVVDAAIEESRDPDSKAVVLHNPGRWFEYMIGQLTIAFPPRDEAGRKGDDHRIKSDRKASKNVSPDAISDEGDGSSRQRYQKPSAESDSDHYSSDETIVNEREPRRARSPPRRGHSATWLVATPARDRQLPSRGARQMRADAAYTPTSPDEQNPRKKYGIIWRRGYGSGPQVWREFRDEKLVDFAADRSGFNITEKDFTRVDRWTEVEKSTVNECYDDALDYLRYPYYEYERFSHMHYETDSEGNPTGPGTPIYISVYHIEMALRFCEMVALMRTARDISTAGRGRNWWRKPVDHPPPPRSDFDMRGDLPYPVAPLGRTGFQTQRALNKGTRWLNTANFVVTALSDPTEIGQNFPKIVRAIKSAGKDIPELGAEAVDSGIEKRIEELDDSRAQPRQIEGRRSGREQG